MGRHAKVFRVGEFATLSMSSTRLEAIGSLAKVDLDRMPLGINAVETNEDGIPSLATPPKPSKLRFIVGGLPFNAAVSPNGDGAICQVWADVGNLPFTVQSPAKRAAMLAVLQSAAALPFARFAVEAGQRIILFCEDRTEGPATPEDIIHQTVKLMGEAKPFLQLLGEFL